MEIFDNSNDLPLVLPDGEELSYRVFESHAFGPFLIDDIVLPVCLVFFRKIPSLDDFHLKGFNVVKIGGHKIPCFILFGPPSFPVDGIDVSNLSGQACCRRDLQNRGMLEEFLFKTFGYSHRDLLVCTTPKYIVNLYFYTQLENYVNSH